MGRKFVVKHEIWGSEGNFMDYYFSVMKKNYVIESVTEPWLKSVKEVKGEGGKLRWIIMYFIK
jgi:hypothetical protein